MRSSFHPRRRWALVLGANLGSAINPVFEGARRDNTRPVTGFRSATSSTGWLGGAAGRPIPASDHGGFAGTATPDLAKMTAGFHIAFNVATAIIFIGLLDGWRGC